MRARAIEDAQKSIKIAEATIAETRARRKQFEDEAEFYKKKTLPPEVQKGLRDADYEITVQAHIIESRNNEIGAIKIKYDEDRRRYLDILRRRAGR